MIPGLRCAYCGAPAAYKLTSGEYVQLVTCESCADLPALDPAYGLAVTIAKGAYPELDLSATSPTSARRETP